MTFIRSAPMLLNVRYGWTFQRAYTNRITTGFDVTMLGFSQNLVQELSQFNPPSIFTFPQVVIDNSAITQLGNNSGGNNSSNYHAIAGTVTKFAGCGFRRRK